MTDSNRMDNYLVPDAIYRAALYREIMNQTPYVSADSWYTHTVQPGERLFPELIAYRVYGDERLKWVVLIAARLDDYRQPLDDGSELVLPSQEWLLDRIRYYVATEKIDVEPKPLTIAAVPLASDVTAPEVPTDDAFQDQLGDALATLASGIPLLSESDVISDETLNKQRHDIQKKLDAVAGILDKFRN